MNWHDPVWGIILMLFLMTVVTRGCPFFMGSIIQQSKTLKVLGKQLPVCIIALLAMYYMMSLAGPHVAQGVLRQVLAIAVTLLVHWRFRQMVISLLLGTVTYLILIMI